MRYGGAVALIVIGAILYFAIRIDVQPVDISLIGLICMVAGAIWLVINLIMDAATRRRRVVPVEERREIIEE
jgi:membrane-bound ClpP family serine protease